jgi:hypothetical protein
MNARFLQLFPRATWAAPLALATCRGLASQASALECPTPQRLSRPGVLKETPTQVAVPLIEADLRARYPGVENAEIVNDIVTAYCPVVNDMKVSDADKQAKAYSTSRPRNAACSDDCRG